MSYYITLEAGKESKKHYENFPVATLLYPKKIREAAIILYNFARTGDNIADEGNFPKKVRIKKLQIFKENLIKINNNNLNVEPLFQDISKIIKLYEIPISLFQRFIDAFKQDVIINRYKNFDEIINYTHNAASPAGEMILGLFKQNSKRNVSYSNSICKALALIGITQDFYEDIKKNRLYIPTNEMKKYKLKITDIHKKEFNNNWKLFKDFWLNRIELILIDGLPLIKNTKGRLSIQVKIMTSAAFLIINRMKNDNSDLFKNPPKLSKIDWFVISCRCILTK